MYCQLKCEISHIKVWGSGFSLGTRTSDHSFHILTISVFWMIARCPTWTEHILCTLPQPSQLFLTASQWSTAFADIPGPPLKRRKILCGAGKDGLATKLACSYRELRFDIQHPAPTTVLTSSSRVPWHPLLAPVSIYMHIVHIHTCKQLHVNTSFYIFVCAIGYICIAWHMCGSQKITIQRLAFYLTWIREGLLSLQSTPGQLAREQPKLSCLCRQSCLESARILVRCYHHTQLLRGPEDPSPESWAYMASALSAEPFPQLWTS